MFVVAAQAGVGPTPVAPPPAVVAVPYGLCGGARKRKDVVQEEVAEGEGRGDGDDDDDAARRRRQQHGGHGLFVLETVEEEGEGDAEGERSSIGAVSDEEEGEEVESKETSWRRKKKGGLTCLDALEDALPIKRGLSNFFSGKSRSFANLQDVTGTSARDVLAKPENPFNKRRRILRCTSIRRVSSTSLTALPPFLPPERPPCNNIGDVNVIHGGGGTGSG